MDPTGSWFSGLTKIANPKDIIAISFHYNSFYIFNLTQLDIEALLNSNLVIPLKNLISEISRKANEI